MGEQRGRIVKDTAVSTLSPERLFDLLANPIERQRWDLCPSYITQEPIETAPGLALAGTRFSIRGTARGIAFTGDAVVTVADRPRRYETRSETTFARAYPAAVAVEEYRIEPEGTGSLVHFRMMISRTPGTGAFLTRVLSAILEPLLTAGAAKRNFRNTLRYAEKEAGLAR